MRYVKVLMPVLGMMLAFASGASGTELTSPAGTKAGLGTKIHASSEGATSITGSITITCKKSTVEGEVTNAGGPNSTVIGSVTLLTFSECGNHTVTVLKPGSLELHDLGNNTATVTSSGVEVTALLHSFLLGTLHCIYTTNKTDIGVLTGSGHGANTTATLDIGAVAIPRVETDGACGPESFWEGSYSVSSPDSLYIDRSGTQVPTFTSPKGSPILTGTEISIASEGATSLTGFVTISCQKSTGTGEVTDAGSSTSTVSGPINTLTFEECGHTVTVVSPGSLELHSLGSNTGTLTSTGMEVTFLSHNIFFGTVHCILKTNETDIGTLTGSEHGTNSKATLDINGAAIPQVPTAGHACGSEIVWDGSYSVSSPDPLYID